MFFASLPSNIVASSSLSSGNQIFKPQMHVTTIISMFKKKKKNQPAEYTSQVPFFLGQKVSHFKEGEPQPLSLCS
jgi:hypothetical protein